MRSVVQLEGGDSLFMYVQFLSRHAVQECRLCPEQAHTVFRFRNHPKQLLAYSAPPAPPPRLPEMEPKNNLVVPYLAFPDLHLKLCKAPRVFLPRRPAPRALAETFLFQQRSHGGGSASQAGRHDGQPAPEAGGGGSGA